MNNTNANVNSNYEKNKYMYSVINSCNMKQLSRKYNNCKNTCIFPVQCLFNEVPVFYKVTGNYDIGFNKEYNTILTFVEDVIVQTFITLKVHITIAFADTPDIIVYETDIIQVPGIYETMAKTNNFVIKSYFNLPNC